MNPTEGDSAPTLSSLLHFSDTFTVKKYFLLLAGHFQRSCACPLALRPVTGQLQKEPGPTHSAAACWVFISTDQIPSQPSRPNRPSSLSLSSEGRCSTPLLILVALHCALSRSSLPLLSSGAQNGTRYSRCGLTRARGDGEDHLPQTAGHALFNATQDPTGLLVSTGTLTLGSRSSQRQSRVTQSPPCACWPPLL